MKEGADVYMGFLNIELEKAVYDNISILKSFKSKGISNALDTKIDIKVKSDNVVSLYGIVKELMENRNMDKYDKTILHNLYLFKEKKHKAYSFTLYLRGQAEDETYIKILKELKDKEYATLASDLVVPYGRGDIKDIKAILKKLHATGGITNIDIYNRKLNVL